MSLQTWKKEFYTEDATNVSKEDAIEHSLKKWRGLTKENLEKHCVVRLRDLICDINGSSRLYIDKDSCALCLTSGDDCTSCPLFESREDVSCDSTTNDEKTSPYHAFTRDGNAEPMIKALEEAKEYDK